MDELIVSILKTRRAHNSAQELKFVGWLRSYLADNLKQEIITLAEGCVAVVVGKKPTTLFSCHVDTVHTASEHEQVICYDSNFGHVFLDKNHVYPQGEFSPNCLGADDGAGIYIMLRMIEAGVEGGYIFHRGEERGGVGAWAVLKENVEFLKKFKACVAFDRPNCDEVIISQGGQPCASETYGKALAEALNLGTGLKYATSTKGVFTDSKIYRGVIRECINLGVGYENQHGRDELLDWTHVLTLLDAVKKVKWDKLPFSRVPVDDSIRAASNRDMRSAGGRQYPKFQQGRQQSLRPFGGGSFASFPDDDDYTLPISFYRGQKKVKEDTPATYFNDLSVAEIEECVGDTDAANAIVYLLCEVEALKARNAKLQELLGLT